MSMKHSATSSMLSVKSPSPATSPPPTPVPGSAPGPAADRLKAPMTEAPKGAGGQRSMLEKFRLINNRGNSRPGADLREEEEESLSEYGEEMTLPPPSGGSKSSSTVASPAASPAPTKSSSKATGGKSIPQPKEKEEKAKAKGKAATAIKEEKEAPAEPTKKTSKIASLIPKGGKSSTLKKEASPPASSGIPKPGMKASPSSSGGKLSGEKPKLTKGGQALYSPRALGGPEGRRTSMVSSTSTSALSGSTATAGVPLAGTGRCSFPSSSSTTPTPPLLPPSCTAPTQRTTAPQWLPQTLASAPPRPTWCTAKRPSSAWRRYRPKYEEGSRALGLPGKEPLQTGPLSVPAGPHGPQPPQAEVPHQPRPAERGPPAGQPPPEPRQAPRTRSLSLSLSLSLSGGQRGAGRQSGEVSAPDRAVSGGEGISARGNSSSAGGRVSGTGAKYWAEDEGGCAREGAAHLDQEVILTMLGHLEQALYTHPLREDPETRRMRTVRNIADLRQNLEETMSSLRGTQISHSTLETTFDSTVTTEDSPAAPACRQASAPSPPPRAGPSRFAHADPSRFVYTAPLRRAAGVGPRGAELGEKSGAEGGPEVEVAGYMSDGDILGKNARPDDISSGYLTDGGLNLYSRNVGRAPDLAASRDVIQRGVNEAQGDIDSWDDSSSVSSGLSDTLDNISTDDLNTPSYSSASASRRKSKEAKSDAHQHSAQDGGSWGGAEHLKKADEGLDSSMDPEHKWKPPSSSSSSTPGHYDDPDRASRATGLPVSHTGSWRRGMTAQVGITPPRTKGTPGTIKTPGKTDDVKASEKGKVPSKAPSIQRSPSDVGKSSGDEGKKPPSGIARQPATSSFGFKKAAGPPGTLITASGAALGSGSATLGKIPKSAAIGKGGAGLGGRKTSLDGSQPQDDGVLLGCGGSRVPLQYRSLPRPAKSSSSGVMGRGGAGGGAGHRSSSSSIDSNVSGKSAGAKRRDAGKIGSGRSSPVTVNQTDKEKVGVSEPDGACLSTSPKASPTSTGQSGLRQPGSKYPDIASPTFRRLFGTKANSKPSSPGTPDSGKCPSALSSPHGTLARQVSLESPSSGTGSLGSAGGQSGGSSPLYGRVPELGTSDASLASSPASCLSLPSAGSRAWPPSISGSSAGSKDTLSCQSMTSLHTSSESIDLAVGLHGSLTGLTSGPKVSRTGSVKSTLSEGMTLDRNTLPKKGLRYPPSSRQTSHEEGKEWLRSHSTGGLQDTGSQSPLSPSGTSCTAAGKYHYSNLLSPTSLSQYSLPGPSMSRSNSIPAHDSSLDLYGEARALGGSATSLEDRPRGMSRSGSFRDSMEEVHGSSLSLVSSTSSLYSATEEKAHSEGQTVQNTTQIRKLRRELDASQEKVATLTSQLAANAHLVAAFEKSLGNMTGRLQSLTMTAEQKESELAELRETIEALKTQNTDAQTAIQVALNGPDHVHRDLKIRRQHSSDSMSSINSGTSHSSIGSAADADAKKKKKKSWVADSIPAQLRSSFKQAFSKKKPNKPPSPHSDIEEQTDSSLPSSPKLLHAAKQGSGTSLRPSPSSNELCECTEAEAEIILQLKNELREKELKLTDIRLEALSSAHHLDQIREAMNRMQNEIELLKAENDRLKSTGNTTPAPTAPTKATRPPSETSSTSSSSSRQSLGLSLNNLNITDTIMSDILLDDGYEGNLRKEGRSVRIVVTNKDDSNKTKGVKCQQYLIGSIGVSGKTKWDVLDGVIRRLFKEYVFRVDPLTSLGLNSDSIVSYRMGDVVRGHASEVPELLPCGYLVGDNNVITVTLKGVKENSIDSLVFDTLIPKPIVQRYLNLLTEHRRIILSGPSGTGKTFLAGKLAEYIINKSGREVTDGNVVSFNVDHKSSKDLRQYLSTLAEQCNSEETETELPLVVILDNLHHIGSLSDIFNGFLNCKYHKCPYVIGTMNQGVSSSPNLELHHNFRWVLCANHTEPVKGFLGRYLRRKLIETEIDKNMRSNDLIKIIDWIPKTWQHLNSFLEAHSSSDVTIGPRLFLSCPMDADGSRVWFTDCGTTPWCLTFWRLCGRGCSFMAREPSGRTPPNVGYDGCSAAKEGASKQVSQSDTEGDPLMNMLMRLQEAANYSSAQSCDSDSTSHHDDLLDSSLESTL
ncbi:hypothetical protein AGOR_G00246420 [Albula goreensis]|uniref:AAA+ ATPase domain-containing protein n=1 Tax=Albula goreensis TaxID=1534307 RepID=A0A8T3CFD3_9TELE|nr:hypothetical protein AGOR_G00246420 [Albula goreensis]